MWFGTIAISLSGKAWLSLLVMHLMCIVVISSWVLLTFKYRPNYSIWVFVAWYMLPVIENPVISGAECLPCLDRDQQSDWSSQMQSCDPPTCICLPGLICDASMQVALVSHWLLKNPTCPAGKNLVGWKTDHCLVCAETSSRGWKNLRLGLSTAKDLQFKLCIFSWVDGTLNLEFQSAVYVCLGAKDWTILCLSNLSFKMMDW